MDLSRQVTLNTFAQILGRASVILISFFTTALLTRQLGQAGYGAFGVISTAVVIFFSFADWGTNLIAVRESSKNPSQSAQILGNSLLVRTLMAFLGIALFLLFIFLNPAFSKFKFEAFLSSFIILFLSLKTSAQIIFHAQLKLHLAALIEFLSSFFFLLFLLFSKSNFSLLLVIFFLLFSAALAAIIALIAAFKIIPPNFQPNPRLIKHLLKESLPMGALLAVFSVYNRLDTFLLQAIKGEAATGIYVLAYKVHDNLVLGAAYLMNSFFPVLSGFPTNLKETKNRLTTLIQKAFDLLLAMALPLVVFIFLLAPFIINLLGGQEFTSSAAVLRILTFATGVAYLNHLTGYSLAALGHQRASLKFGLLALLVNLTLNLIFIPQYSYFAAAAVTFLSELLVFSLSFRYLRQIGYRLNFSSFPRTVWEFISQKGKVF